MEMVVSIDMIEGQPGLAKRRELGADFRFQLPTGRRAKEDIDAGAHHIDGETPARIDQIGYSLRRQDRPPVHDDHMQTHPEGRQGSGTGHRVGRRGRPHHQAGRGQYALAVRDLDRRIDRLRKAEIVRRNDESPQA